MHGWVWYFCFQGNTTTRFSSWKLVCALSMSPTRVILYKAIVSDYFNASFPPKTSPCSAAKLDPLPNWKLRNSVGKVSMNNLFSKFKRQLLLERLNLFFPFCFSLIVCSSICLSFESQRKTWLFLWQFHASWFFSRWHARKWTLRNFFSAKILTRNKQAAN